MKSQNSQTITSVFSVFSVFSVVENTKPKPLSGYARLILNRIGL